MEYVILISAIVFSVSQTFIRKGFADKYKSGVFAFSFWYSIVAAAAFIILAAVKGTLVFSLSTLPYALMFAAAYGTSLISGTLVYKYGPLALSSLIGSYSLLIPTFYGAVFEKAPLTVFIWIGLVLFAVSLFLTNYKKGADNEKKISIKWIVFLVISFISNGLCSVFQRLEQTNVPSQYSDTFMIEALLIASAVIAAASFISESKNDRVSVTKGALCPAALCGVSNAIVNAAVMFLSNRSFPTAVMFPVISAGGIVIIFIASVTFFKEKMSPLQVIGFVLGILSIIFFNL